MSRNMAFWLVFILFVFLPHYASISKWRDNGHAGLQLWDFYSEATGSDWLFYHKDFWIPIGAGLVLMFIIATGARGKR